MDKDYDFDAVKTWLGDNNIEVLNVAGPRGSKFPDVYDKTKEYMKKLLRN